MPVQPSFPPIDMHPLWAGSAPYFAALVASSWSTLALPGSRAQHDFGTPDFSIGACVQHTVRARGGRALLAILPATTAHVLLPLNEGDPRVRLQNQAQTYTVGSHDHHGRSSGHSPHKWSLDH